MPYSAKKKGEKTMTNDKERNPEQKVPTTAKAPEGYKVNPLYIEVKSRRLQLVLQPSLYNRVKTAAAVKGLSVNEYIHRVLDEATKGNE